MTAVIVILILMMIGLVIDSYNLRMKLNTVTFDILNAIKDSQDNYREELQNIQDYILRMHSDFGDSMKSLTVISTNVAEYIQRSSMAMESLSNRIDECKNMVGNSITDGQWIISKMTEIGSWVQKAILVDDSDTKVTESGVVCGFRPKPYSKPCIASKNGYCMTKDSTCKYRIENPICGSDQFCPQKKDGLCMSDLFPCCIHLVDAPKDPVIEPYEPIGSADTYEKDKNGTYIDTRMLKNMANYGPENECTDNGKLKKSP